MQRSEKESKSQFQEKVEDAAFSNRTTSEAYLGVNKDGHYFSGCFDRKQYLSPLYGAKIYTGELSGEYKFMKPLSEKLHKDPAFGKVLWEIGHDLDFFQPQ